MFWNNVESSVANSSLKLDKVKTAQTVIHGTKRLIKTALNEVDSTLKTDVSNNEPNERKRPAEEASPFIRPPSNLRDRSLPPSYNSFNDYNEESTEVEDELTETSPKTNDQTREECEEDENYSDDTEEDDENRITQEKKEQFRKIFQGSLKFKNCC
ncbi:hypothetical protein C1645_832434 [Glomus cerebriforme]|uniref:Uncharacterized protein n=1 Tax=Glomus cerebriforme TaxID=658196 RepID=A0A397SN93_9GLOM|nr:hypothetical protein C1645_832434 [Glomus cerebriforme]